MILRLGDELDDPRFLHLVRRALVSDERVGADHDAGGFGESAIRVPLRKSVL